MFPFPPTPVLFLSPPTPPFPIAIESTPEALALGPIVILRTPSLVEPAPIVTDEC